MSLDVEIQHLLRSNEVRQIDFTMAGIQVSGHGFWELSNCFSDHPMAHRIRVTVRPALVGPHAAASYDPELDKIHLRTSSVLSTATGRAGVVHECTHAQIDLRGITTSTRSEEGAAFIAEAWYLLACHVDVASVSPGFPADITQIAADLKQRATGSIGQPVAMTADQINRARRVMAGFDYPSTHYTSDGVRGHRYRGP